MEILSNRIKIRLWISFFSSSDININKISLGGVEINDILKNEKFKINDFTPYIPISTKTIQEKKN